MLDFSTIKNELFPVIASVFTKTSSLGIKVRGLEAFVILCGGSNDPGGDNDGLNGIMNENASKKSSSSALDKYTMQEKIVPLVKGIKTKEPAVAIAALNVLRQVGGTADADFVAMDILPVLWSMSLGPLLDLKQFQSFMELIKSLSLRVESEQTKKLQELSGSNGTATKNNDDFMTFGGANAFSTNGNNDDGEVEFERLVKGTVGPSNSSNPLDAGWDSTSAPATSQTPHNVSNKSQTPSFAWSTPSPTATSGPSMNAALRPQPASRTITPDLSRFDALTPASTQFSQPLQPSTSGFASPLQSPPQNSWNSAPLQPQPTSSYQPPPPSTLMNWGSAATSSNAWASTSSSAPLAPPPASNYPPQTSNYNSMSNSMSTLSMNQPRSTSAFSLPPQQRPGLGASNSFSLPPPPGGNTYQGSTFAAPQQQSAFGIPPPQQQNTGLGIGQQKKSGLDAWESLL